MSTSNTSASTPGTPSNTYSPTMVTYTSIQTVTHEHTVTARPTQTRSQNRPVMSVPASLYFITLAIAVGLIVGISTALICRNAVIRARYRRRVAITAMEDAARGLILPSSKPPVLWDVWTSSASKLNDDHGHHRWETVTPLSVAPAPVVLQRGQRLVPTAPARTPVEFFLRLPALPPGAEEHLPQDGNRIDALLRRLEPRERQLQRQPPAPPAASTDNVFEVAHASGSQGGGAMRIPAGRLARVGVLLAMPSGEVLVGTTDTAITTGRQES